MILQDPYSHPLVSDPLGAVSERYYQRLVAALHYRSAAANAAAPAVAYTAMHGVGTPWVQEVRRGLGLAVCLFQGGGGRCRVGSVAGECAQSQRSRIKQAAAVHVRALCALLLTLLPRRPSAALGCRRLC